MGGCVIELLASGLKITPGYWTTTGIYIHKVGHMFSFANLSMLLGFPIIADQFQTKITRCLFHACMILDDIG